MRAEIYATEEPGKLVEHLERRVDSVEMDGDMVVAELDDPELLERVPGIDEYVVDGERHEGLKGRPVQEEAYARIETKKDVARALLATINGYDLRILNSELEWDIMLLKRFNPDIKHLKFDEPRDFLEIEKSISDVDGTDKIDIEMSDEEAETVYSFMMP
ncbi:MAG: hypothetical protein ABEJ75_00490 [Candidatus Nanohaloarchaea archaeon]